MYPCKRFVTEKYQKDTAHILLFRWYFSCADNFADALELKKTKQKIYFVNM